LGRVSGSLNHTNFNRNNHMISFSIPRITADRLARLGLACADDTTAISHIGVRVTLTGVRFSSTNGRLLCSLLVPVDDFIGTPTDLILDQVQLATAVKAAAKGSGRINFKIDEAEARVTSGTVASVVRRVAGTFPNVDHVWTRPAGRRWVPTMSSIDPGLAAIAQKITGAKSAVLFSSPVDPGARLERLWAVPAAQPDESISLASLRAVVAAPAYWSDGFELAILLMPITRGDSERQLNLDAHAMPLLQPAALAA
jgi:hypothetical protein